MDLVACSYLAVMAGNCDGFAGVNLVYSGILSFC